MLAGKCSLRRSRMKMLSRLAITLGNSGKTKNCKCKDCKKHNRYCTLYDFPLPGNVALDIYGFAPGCYTCPVRERRKEVFDDIK